MSNALGNDCQILFVGQNHETYRGVNQALKPMGLSVMWAQDLESAQMLAKTTRMELLLCDEAIEREDNRLFERNTIQPGVSCLEMAMPKPDPNGHLFEQNMFQTAKLIQVVSNLTKNQALSPTHF